MKHLALIALLAVAVTAVPRPQPQPPASNPTTTTSNPTQHRPSEAQLLTVWREAVEIVNRDVHPARLDIHNVYRSQLDYRLNIVQDIPPYPQSIPIPSAAEEVGRRVRAANAEARGIVAYDPRLDFNTVYTNLIARYNLGTVRVIRPNDPGAPRTPAPGTPAGGYSGRTLPPPGGQRY